MAKEILKLNKKFSKKNYISILEYILYKKINSQNIFFQ